MSVPSEVVVGNEDDNSQGEGGDEGQANDPIIETEALRYPESGVVPQGNKYEDERNENDIDHSERRSSGDGIHEVRLRPASNDLRRRMHG